MLIHLIRRLVFDGVLLPTGRELDLPRKRAKDLVRRGYAMEIQKWPPIEVTINTNVDEIEVAEMKPVLEFPEKPKRRRRKKVVEEE